MKSITIFQIVFENLNQIEGTNMLKFKILFLSSIMLLTIPCGAKSEFLEQDSKEISELLFLENLEESMVRSNSSKKNPKLKLKDLAGDWGLFVETTGGLGDGVGACLSGDAQATIRKDGTGIVNKGTTIEYRGVPGQVSIVDLSGFTLKVTINNSKLGTGTIALTSPSGIVRSIDFVALSKKGRFDQLEGHEITITPSFHRITQYTLIRQHQ